MNFICSKPGVPFIYDGIKFLSGGLCLFDSMT